MGNYNLDVHRAAAEVRLVKKTVPYSDRADQSQRKPDGDTHLSWGGWTGGTVGPPLSPASGFRLTERPATTSRICSCDLSIQSSPSACAASVRVPRIIVLKSYLPKVAY